MTEPYRYAPAAPRTPDLVLGGAMQWLNNKAFASQFPNWFTPKAQLPVLGKAINGKASRALIQAINQRLGQLQYHPDHFNGVGDLYNHPCHTEYLLQHQGPNEKRPRDCDDYATFGHGLALTAGVSGMEVWIWNLIVGNQIKDAKWNHVILGMTCADAPGKIFVLDTCSAAWGSPIEFTGTKWGVEAEVRKYFGEAFRDEKTGEPRNYAWLIDVPPPFLIRT